MFGAVVPTWAQRSTVRALCAQLLQLCLILCHPMDCSPPDSSDHVFFQVRILEWVAISFSMSGTLEVTKASFIVQSVKNLPAMQETQVRFLHREDPLEKEMAVHSSILAWKIPDRGA